MKKSSGLFLFGILTLVLLTTACGADQGATATLVGTALTSMQETSTPLGVDTTMTAETATGSSTETAAIEVTATPSPAEAATKTQAAPGTGLDLDIVLVECQFCVDTLAHALMVLPDTATFEVVSAITTSTLPTNCSTIEVNNGKQVILCSGPESTNISLNICTNSNNCTNLPVKLLACPITQSNNTAVAPTKVESTPEPGTGSATSTLTLTPESLPSPSLTPTQ